MTPIVIAFTPNYIVPAATLVQSVLGSSEGDFEFICLTTEAIPESQQELLRHLGGKRAAWKYITIDALPEGVYIDPRYGAAAEFRLILPELLPDYDNIIYIDCDIIVRNDLERLYTEIDLGNNLLGAVFEREGYFNSGFLVMNLKQMRKEHTSAELIKTLRSGEFEFPDQDALNIVCEGKVLGLPAFYNSIRTFWLPQYKNDFLKIYTEADFEEMMSHGTVHYTGGKPWTILSVKFDTWWEEYYRLPKDIRVLLNTTPKIRILSRIYSTRAGRTLLEGLRTLYRNLTGKI